MNDFSCEAVRSWNFACQQILIRVSILVLVIVLFIFPISPWFCLRMLYLSKNLFISSKLSLLLASSCSRASQVVLVVKNPAASAGDVRDMDLTSGLGRSPGEGNGNPLQYSCLENPKDRGAWWATVHGVAKSWPRLRDYTCMQIQKYIFFSNK